MNHLYFTISLGNIGADIWWHVNVTSATPTCWPPIDYRRLITNSKTSATTYINLKNVRQNIEITSQNATCWSNELWMELLPNLCKISEQSWKAFFNRYYFKRLLPVAMPRFQSVTEPFSNPNFENIIHTRASNWSAHSFQFCPLDGATYLKA